MKKVELVKKLGLSVFVMLYGIVSLLWCYVFVESLIFNFFDIAVGKNGLEIIGGTNMSTLLFQAGNIVSGAFLLFFVFLSVATVFLLTVLIFKKQTNQKLSVLLSVFSALSLVVFMLIPPQTYVISLYALVSKVSFLKYIQFIYIVLSLMIILINILFTIKRSNKIQ